MVCFHTLLFSRMPIGIAGHVYEHSWYLQTDLSTSHVSPQNAVQGPEIPQVASEAPEIHSYLTHQTFLSRGERAAHALRLARKSSSCDAERTCLPGR